MGTAFVPAVQLSVNEKDGSIRAAYLRVRQGEVAETREVAEGTAFADYDAGGLLLGIEILAPCTVEVLDRIAAQEPDPVRRFLRGGVPRELVPA
jgi:uncharacterized protein YuzE